jgi:hypothetical protein
MMEVIRLLSFVFCPLPKAAACASLLANVGLGGCGACLGGPVWAAMPLAGLVAQLVRARA